MNVRTRLILSGAAAGLAGGLFGGGGGMVFLPLASGVLPARKLYATCVGVILPACAVSAGVYALKGGLDIAAALPYLAGGFAGGIVGGRLYGRLPTGLLRHLFAAFLLYAGVRYLL